MRLRQEQVVFLVACLVLALMTWSLFSGGAKRRGRGGGSEEAEFTHYAAPPVDVALSNGARPPLRRELFAPPRDTRVLPPLELVEPPRLALADLFPPTDPGPAPAAYSALLRRTVPFVEVPDLFAGEEEEAEDADLDATGAAGAARDAIQRGEESNLDLLRSARDDAIDPFADETATEREARFARYRETYDWIQRGPGQTVFGRIENEDRYGLKTDLERASEDVLFVQIDPETGIETFRSVGAPPIAVPRDQIVDFDFAGTVANRIEVQRGLIGDTLTRGSFAQALELADYCVLNRLEAPRALAVAEDLYRLAASYDPEDLEPRLGLARCLEAGFRFEEAFAEYSALLDTFSHHAALHARIGLLEERFLLHDRAEERLRQAVSVDRNQWEARFALGGFLSRRGRHEEALDHLRSAFQSAPTEPKLLHVRVAIRVALADALFALGRVDEARALYEQALQADAAAQRARAGLLATALLGNAQPDTAIAPVDAAAGAALGAPSEGEGYELLLVRGTSALLEGDHATSRDLLRLAVDADPLRAARPLSALGHLALVTGNDADAMGFLEEAVARDPGDAYALYLRGRLLGRQDDYEGARASLLAALDREIDFEDALVALGEMAFGLGRFEDAERYLERAIAIDPRRPPVHALRGVNFLRLGSVPDARAAFDEALSLDGAEPTSRAGKAWCAYLDGEVTEALILLANLDEGRRDQPEDDPWRVWSREQILRIQDHVQKVEWRDNFNRSRLINGWLTREGSGPTVAMDEGAVKIEGLFDTIGSTQVYREYLASDFVSFSADLWISPTSNVRTGIFIARERQTRRSRDVIGEASVSRHKDGSLQVRIVRQGQPEELTDMQESLPTGEWVRLSIQREGVSSDTTITISLDGVPLIENVPVPSVGGANSPLLVGLFAEGETARQVLVKMDEVSAVYRGNR
jgi:tetratricopeptide (TPR) repeat protein